MGFEPTDGGFADLSLRPLGYRAGTKKYIQIPFYLSVLVPLGPQRDGEASTCASRKKRADSSGGVGQM